jgi:group I intron endonuclease
MTICIYKITNKANDKIYIGQTVRYEERMKEHFSKELCTGKKFKNAINKYGEDSFICEVLEEFDESDDKDSLRTILDEREQFYLDLYKPFDDIGYNLQKSVGHTNLGRKWSDEVKKSISDSLKKYHETHDNSFKGRTHTEESKKKMSDALIGRTYSEEQKQKMRLTSIKNNSIQHITDWQEKNGDPRLKPITQLDKQTGSIISTFTSTTNAYEKTGIGRTSITNCLRGYSKSAGGYKWEYFDNIHK